MATDSPTLNDYLAKIVGRLEKSSPVRIPRKEAVSLLQGMANKPDAALLFEEWEHQLRHPVLFGNWALSYSVYSDSIVAEYVPGWSQIERAADIRGRTLRHAIESSLSALSPNAFSLFLANLFSKASWANDVTITKQSRDGGIDFQGYYVYPDREKVPLHGQAKHWKSKVGSEPIRTFIGSVVAQAGGKPCVGVYVCAGGFTPDALRDTKRAPFMLLKYDITGLVDLMLEFKVGVEDYRLDCPRIDDRFWDEIG